MGRITIFIADECANSKLVLETLKQYSISYQVICLSNYPHRRADMIKLTNCLTTPQVFFNKKHIGGASEVISLTRQYDEESKLSGYPSVFERISMEVLKRRKPSKNNTMLSIPKINDASTIITLSIQEQNERIRSSDGVHIINGEERTVNRITRDLMKWLPRKSFGLISSSKNRFSASEAIEVFKKRYHFPSSKCAIAFGQNLLWLGILHRVSTDYISCGLFDEGGYFRLQPLQSPEIFNSYRIWTSYSFLDISPRLTISWLIRQMAEIITSVTSAGGKVDYSAAQTNTKFRNFEENVCQLQLIKLESMNEGAKKAFFINVFNLMMTHAFFRLRPKKVNNDFFTSVHYKIGGYIFSLEDIYHGILRNNAKHPKTGIQILPESDPRATFSLQKKDARIHFALNNGLGSCVVVHEYHPEAIDEELDAVSQLYCASNERVSINSYTNQVILPKFMSIYISDFTEKDECHKLLGVLSKYLDIDRRDALTSMLVRGKKSGVQVTVLFGDKHGSLHISAAKCGFLLKTFTGRRKRRKQSLSQKWVELCSDSDDSTVGSSEGQLEKLDEHVNTSQQKTDCINALAEIEIDSVFAPFKSKFSSETLCKPIHQKVLSSSANIQPDIIDLDSISPVRYLKTESDNPTTPLQNKCKRAKTPTSVSSNVTALTIDVSTDESSSSSVIVKTICDELAIPVSEYREKIIDTEPVDPPHPLRIVSGASFMSGEESDQKYNFTTDSLRRDKYRDTTDCAMSFLSSSIISVDNFNNSNKHASNDEFEALYNT